MDLSSLPDGSLLKTCLLQGIPVKKISDQYQSSDWRRVRFLKSHPSPVGYDLPMYLDDKAISPDLDKLLHSLVNDKSLGSAKDRKLLLSFIESEDINLRDLMEEFMTEGPLISDLLIGLNPKEKELKSDPRMFATMPMRVRLVQVVREHLSKGLKPLFPDITMTDDYKKLEMRKHNMGRDQVSVSEGRTVRISLDFSKWCNSLR